MADINAKLIVRQGDFAQLPILSSGELAFASDLRRLFIGNTPDVRTGDGATQDFVFGVDLDGLNGQYFIDIDGQSQQLTADFTVDNFTVRFLTPPANGATITFNHNSEIMLTTPPEGVIDLPQDVALTPGDGVTPSSAILLPSIAFDTERFGNAKIRYTINNDNNASRRGEIYLGFYEDSLGVTQFTIEDKYSTNADQTGVELDHVFSGQVDPATGVFVLSYVVTDSAAARITWIEDHFAVAVAS